jgi:GNAT superfamily N-acetyltransferase
MNTEIRKANSKDIEYMIKILESSAHKNHDGAGEYYLRDEFTDPNYASTSGPYYSTNLFLKNNILNLRKRLRKPYTTYVLLLKKEIIGYIIIENYMNRYWVNDLVIKKEYRRFGYGKKLFNHALKNKKEVYLWVNDKNPGKKFWEKLGFKTILTESLMKK